MGCGEIEFRFKLEDRTTLRAKVSLSQPTVEARKIISQLELKLSGSKLTSAVKEILFSVFEFAPLESKQLSLND